jgi:parallel beta-helix repeat protein
VGYLATTMSLMLPAPPLHATGVACGDVVTRDTVLNGDLVDCPADGLIVGADHIVIELNDHSISGLGAPGTAGIRNSGHDGVTVRNGDFSGLDVSGFDIGILLADGTERTTVRGLFVEGERFGIALVGADRNLIQGNSARNVYSSDECGRRTPRAGIALFQSDRNRIEGNDAELSGFGIALFHAEGNRIAGNRAAPAESDGNGCDGIALFDSDGNRVERNLTDNNGNVGFSDGILVDSHSSGTRLDRNLAGHNLDDGIDVDDPGTRISRNTADDNADFGIEAVEGVIDGGRNEASGNGNPLQCLNVDCS